MFEVDIEAVEACTPGNGCDFNTAHQTHDHADGQFP